MKRLSFYSQTEGEQYHWSFHSRKSV